MPKDAKTTDEGYGRFTKEEMALLKRTFQDNLPLLKLLRKVFLPSYDYDAPLGQVVDLWMGVPFKQLTPDQAWLQGATRNDLITHVEAMIMQLQSLAGIREETADEKKARLKKDSTK